MEKVLAVGGGRGEGRRVSGRLAVVSEVDPRVDPSRFAEAEVDALHNGAYEMKSTAMGGGAITDNTEIRLGRADNSIAFSHFKA